MKKGMKQTCFALLTLLAVFGWNTKVEAAITQMPTTTQIEEVVSSEYLKNEYYKVKTPSNEKNVIYVEGKTKVATKRFAIRIFNHASSNRTYYVTVFVTPNANGEFAVKINTAKGNKSDAVATKGSVVPSSSTYGSCPGYNTVSEIPAGYYHLTIARATTTSDADVSRGAKWYSGTLGGSYGYAYKEALLQVKSGQENNLKLVKYPAIVDNNNTIKKKYDTDGSKDEIYLDPYMTDLSYMFTNPKTGVKTPMTDSRLSYIKGIANKVTSGATSDYEKLLKIYEYVAGNTYYDRLAYETKQYQFVNPYLNIYNMEKKVTSDNSTGGKMATTCQGYASMVILLARTEGIPARIVNGSHISYPLYLWSDKKLSEITSVTHWWAEAYVDGRWIIIDANAGTNSIWKRSSFSASGTWTSYGVTSYIGFDPSIEQLSNCYSYVTIKSGGNKTVAASSLTAKLSATSYKYDGKVKTPGVTVTNASGKKLTKGTDYTVSYASGRKNVGTYSVKLTFKGNYTGTKSLSFKIKPSSTTLKKLTTGKKRFTAKWTKKTAQVTGYQIQYSTSSSFKNAKTVTISSSKTTSKTIKSLKAKKKYYVRIRTYKKVGTTKYYSEWSSKKTVTTKK